MRLHLPMQLFTGIVARASRSSDRDVNQSWKVQSHAVAENVTESVAGD
jgi:hypothetical protein